MKTALIPPFWLVSVLLLLPSCASSAPGAGGANTQHDQLLLNGKLTDVSLTRDPDQVSLTISGKFKKGHPPDWSRVKPSVYCFPGREDLGGFRFDMTLARTNTSSGKRASALFVFKGEPSLIDKVAKVLVDAYPDAGCFTFPLSREEVLARFRARASAEEVRQFEALRLSKDTLNQERALELVLFKLTGGEWERIGIWVALTVPFFGQEQWYVAGGPQNEDTCKAVYEELGRAQIAAGCSGGCGVMNWIAPKEQFFRARRALLQSKDPRVRGCAVPPPQFSLH